MKRITISIALITALCPSVGIAQVGFAWADRPSDRKYTPDSRYSYNSSGGQTVVVRHDIGTYSVHFSGLRSKTGHGGHVQVTGYGSSADVCKVARWAAQAKEFVVDVQCFNPSGHLLDARYTVLAGWFRPTAAGGPPAALRRIDPIRVPGRGGDEKADAATVRDVQVLADMINALFAKVEELRQELNKLAR